MTILAMSIPRANHAIITTIIITTIGDGTSMAIGITSMVIGITIMVIDDRRIDLNHVRRRAGT
jgi:hypothetical protein